MRHLESTKRIWTRSLLALAALASMWAASANQLRGATGDVRLPGLRGGQLTSADLAQGNVVVVVWASWSPRCRDIVARANAIDAKWKDKARVVTVNFQEDAAKVEDFLRGQSLRTPVFLDSDGAYSKAMAVTSLPGLVIYHGGEVAYQGKLPADSDTLIERSLR